MNFRKLLLLIMNIRIYIFVAIVSLAGVHYIVNSMWSNPIVTFDQNQIWFNPTVTLDEIETQLKKDASAINATDDGGFTGLMKAVSQNDYEKAELLLKYGAGVNARFSGVNIKAMNRDPQVLAHFDGVTPLHLAVMYGNYLTRSDINGIYWYDPTDMAQLLLNYGADVNARDKNNDTPMHKLFFMDQSGTEDRRFQMLELLLAYGADINAQNNQGFTMAHIAAERNYGAWLQRMIAVYGDIIDFSLKDNAGLTPRNLADKNGYGFLVEIIDFILKPVVGIDGNARERDQQGRTGLMHAIARNNYELAQELIKRGADVNAVDNDGNTPLYYAVNNKRRPLLFVTLLLARGAEVNNSNKDGMTPLLLATSVLPLNERVPVVSQLLAKGAAQNVQDKRGNTPLHRAILNNDVALVSVLKKGFSSTLANNQGLMAEQLAVKRNNPLILKEMR